MPVSLDCKCRGYDLDSQCEDPATEEDGLCGLCRDRRCEDEAPQFARDLRAAASRLRSPSLTRLADELDARLSSSPKGDTE